jgi:hypothetical protein
MPFSISNADILDDKVLAKKKTELKTYLKCLEYFDSAIRLLCQNTLIMLNPDDAEVADWYNLPSTGKALVDFMVDKQNHLIDKWNIGEFGSRWINTILEGKDIRICFYSKKNDTKMWENMPEHLQSNKFMLLIALN